MAKEFQEEIAIEVKAGQTVVLDITAKKGLPTPINPSASDLGAVKLIVFDENEMPLDIKEAYLINEAKTGYYIVNNTEKTGELELEGIVPGEFEMVLEKPEGMKVLAAGVDKLAAPPPPTPTQSFAELLLSLIGPYKKFTSKNDTPKYNTDANCFIEVKHLLDLAALKKYKKVLTPPVKKKANGDSEIETFRYEAYRELSKGNSIYRPGFDKYVKATNKNVQFEDVNKRGIPGALVLEYGAELLTNDTIWGLNGKAIKIKSGAVIQGWETWPDGSSFIFNGWEEKGEKMKVIHTFYGDDKRYHFNIRQIMVQTKYTEWNAVNPDPLIK